MHTGKPEHALGRYDAGLGWAMLPDVDTRVYDASFAYDVRTNSRGLRDRAHDYAKPAGTLRVALLGDSVGWGWGVDDGQGFADLLEARLGAGVEIVNLCVPGYSTDQELWVLEGEGARYAPDLVLVCFVQNDIIGNWHSRDKPAFVRGADGAWTIENRPVERSAIEVFARKPSWTSWLFAHSALLQALRPGVANVREPPEWEEQARQARRPGVVDRFPTNYAAALDDIRAPDGLTHMLLARIAARARELGAETWVFAVPGSNDPWLLDPALPAPEIPAERPYTTELTHALRDAGALAGFRTHSVDQALLDEVRTGRVLHCGDQAHLDERGNQIVADVLEAPLRAFVAARRAAPPSGG